MRFFVYDENGLLFRKFWTKQDAEKFLQKDWQLVIQPKQKPIKPTSKVFGIARW